MLFANQEGTFFENLSVMERTTISDISCLFAQGNGSLKSGKSQIILKTDVCGNNLIRAFCKENSQRKGAEGDS